MSSIFTIHKTSGANRAERRCKKGAFRLEANLIKELSPGAVLVYSFLRSCIDTRGIEKNGHPHSVCIPHATIAYFCGLSTRSVQKHLDDLFKLGKIEIYSQDIKGSKFKGANIYVLPEILDKNYILVPRSIFNHFFKIRGKNRKYFKSSVTPQMFCLILFFIKAHHHELGKSWNSANDIIAKTGGKITTSRSQMWKLIGKLSRYGIVKKTVRKMFCKKGKRFVDNIYRIDKEFLVDLKKEYFKKRGAAIKFQKGNGGYKMPNPGLTENPGDKQAKNVEQIITYFSTPYINYTQKNENVNSLDEIFSKNFYYQMSLFEYERNLS